MSSETLIARFAVGAERSFRSWHGGRNCKGNVRVTQILLPTVLRQHSDGHGVVDVRGASVREALIELTDMYPPLREHLLEQGGGVRQHINVFVNDDNIRDRDNQDTVVSDRDEIVIVPALAGG